MSCSNSPNSSHGEQQRNQINSSLSVSSLSETNSPSRVSVPDLYGASVQTPPRVNSPPPSTHAVNLTALFEDEAPREEPNEFPTFEIVNDVSSSIWPELMDSDECRPLNSCRVSAVPPEGWIPADASDDNWLYDDDEPSKDVIGDSKVVPSMIGAGLANLGNTCFLNSIMQCFTHTVPLVEGLLLCSHSPNDGHNGYCVICAFRYHVRHSLQSTGRIFSPVILVDNLNHFSSLFRRHQQEDAHEFMQCALDKLERCFLNLKKNDPSFEDDNIVNKVFGGRLVSKLRCCNCGRSSDTNEPLIDLSLEIENVETLSSALESFTMVEDIDAKFRCEGCKQEVSMEKQLMLDQTPSIATFHLKRFKTDGILVEKIDKHINFPLELDLQPFTISNENNNVSLKYDLYAVVVHSGFSSTSGHYFCFVRSAPDTWHKLDDSKVSKVSEETVLSQEGYILFYARQGTPWISSFMESQIPCLDLSRMNTSPKSVLDITDGQNKSFPILHEDIERSKADESKEFSEKYSLQESCEFLEIDDIINATHDYEYEKFPAQTSNQEAVSLNGLEDINAQVLPENSTMMTCNAKHGGSSYTEYGAPDKNKRSPEVVDYRENDCFNPLTPPNSPPFDTPGKTFQISRDHLKTESQGSSGKRSSSNKLTGNPEKKAALTYLKKMSGSRRSVLMDLVGDCHSKSSTENKRKKIDSLQSDKGNTLSARKKSSHASVTGYPVATRVSQKSPENYLPHPDHDFTSPVVNTDKHVVVVMDGMTEFTTEPLQWALDNVVTADCTVTLLGVMPWLNIPLFLKTRNDFWTVGMEDAPLVREKNECRKRQAVIDLCRKYGVVPQKKIVMGYPLRLLVVEQIVTLSPTWVVFDRSHRKNKEFYAKKIPCNILMMNEDGRFDMIKSKWMSHNDQNISKEFSLSSAPTPQLSVSEESREAIK